LDPDPAGLPIFFLASLLLVAATNLHGRCRPRESRGEDGAADRLTAAVARAVELVAVAVGVIFGLGAAGLLGGEKRPLTAAVALLAILLCRDLLPRWLAVMLPEIWRQAIHTRGNRCLHPLIALIRATATILPHRSPRTAEGVAGAPLESDGDEESDQTIRELLENFYDFGETSVREVMTPRPDVFALEASTPADAVVENLLEGRYSRVPVIHGDLDHVAGIIYAKDVLAARHGGEMPPLAVLMQKPLFVPETQKISDLLRDFQATHVHIAIAVDEHGSTAGLVCMEDILRELVGEVGDSEPDEAIVELSESVFQVPAMTPPEVFNETFGTHIGGEGFETIGGFVVTSLDHFPEVGETVEVDGHVLKVTVIDGLRIRTLEVRVPVTAERA
jgi:CBS domain containing-hemolysin-like protein